MHLKVRNLASNESPVASGQGESNIPDANDVFLSAAQVRRRYGGISAMTLHRWLHDPALDFCKPIYISARRYWKLSDLEEFERRRVGERAVTDQSKRASYKALHSRTGG
jgi:hypothetical protein